MGQHWRPLFDNLRQHRDSGPYEGVPPWLAGDLERWLRMQLTVSERRQRVANIPPIRRAARLLGVGLENVGVNYLLEDFIEAVRQSDQLMLEAVNVVLTMSPGENPANDLEAILSDGVSAWRVVGQPGAYHLERRVDEATTAAVDAVISSTGRAGQHLASAWAELYAVEARPKLAYDESVLAVDAVAKPVITPLDSRATLGR